MADRDALLREAEEEVERRFPRGPSAARSSVPATPVPLAAPGADVPGPEDLLARLKAVRAQREALQQQTVRPPGPFSTLSDLLFGGAERRAESEARTRGYFTESGQPELTELERAIPSNVAAERMREGGGEVPGWKLGLGALGGLAGYTFMNAAMGKAMGAATKLKGAEQAERTAAQAAQDALTASVIKGPTGPAVNEWMAPGSIASEALPKPPSLTARGGSVTQSGGAAAVSPSRPPQIAPAVKPPPAAKAEVLTQGAPAAQPAGLSTQRLPEELFMGEAPPATGQRPPPRPAPAGEVVSEGQPASQIAPQGPPKAPPVPADVLQPTYTSPISQVIAQVAHQLAQEAAGKPPTASQVARQAKRAQEIVNQGLAGRMTDVPGTVQSLLEAHSLQPLSSEAALAKQAVIRQTAKALGGYLGVEARSVPGIQEALVRSGVDPAYAEQAATKVYAGVNVRQMLDDLLTTVPGAAKAWSGVKQEVLSPHTVFGRAGADVKGYEGTSKEIWRLMAEADDKRRVSLGRFSDFLRQVSGGIKEGSPSSARVALALDTEGAAGTALVAQLTPTERRLYDGLRTYFDEAAGRLGLSPERRITTYFPHIFDRDELFRGFKEELATLLGEQSKVLRRPELALEHLTDAKGTKALIAARLQAGLLTPQQAERATLLADRVVQMEANPQRIMDLFDDVPRGYKFGHLEERTGAKGYQLDAIRAASSYDWGLAKKLYLEPAVKASIEKMPGLAAEMKPYARWFLRRAWGLDQSPFDELAAMVTGYEYLSKMGLNMGSVVQNATQHLNTIVDIGPHWTARGWKIATRLDRSPLGQAANRAFDDGHYLTDLIHWEGQQFKALDKVTEKALKPFIMVESGNRRTAFAGAYARAIEQLGMPAEAAVKYAQDVMYKTQFRYGLDMPRILTRPIGKIAGQFQSFSIKQLELLAEWHKQNPWKVAAYIAASQGTIELASGRAAGRGGAVLEALGVEGAKQKGQEYDFPGINLTGAVGLIGRSKEVTLALQAMAEADWPSMAFHLARSGLPFVSKRPEGIYPSVLPSIESPTFEFTAPAFRDLSGLGRAAWGLATQKPGATREGLMQAAPVVVRRGIKFVEGLQGAQEVPAKPGAAIPQLREMLTRGKRGPSLAQRMYKSLYGEDPGMVLQGTPGSEPGMRYPDYTSKGDRVKYLLPLSDLIIRGIGPKPTGQSEREDLLSALRQAQQFGEDRRAEWANFALAGKKAEAAALAKKYPLFRNRQEAGRYLELRKKRLGTPQGEVQPQAEEID